MNEKILETQKGKWLILGLIFLIYVFNMSRFVSFHDSLSFLLDASKDFSFASNATNHLLYNNFQHLLLRVFAFLPPVLVLTSFTIFCALGTLNLLFDLLAKVSSHRIASLLTLPIMGLSFTWWQQSEIIEVYTFNALILVAFLNYTIRDLLAGNKRHWFGVSMLLGLGLLTHIQHLLTVPFYLVYLFYEPRDWKKIIGGLAIVGSLFSLLFVFSSVFKVNTFPEIFFDRHFKEDVLGFEFSAFLKGIWMSFLFIIYNFHFFLYFVFRGAIRIWKKNRKLAYFLLLVFLPYFLFGIKYNVSDNHVFFISAYLVMMIPCAEGVKGFLEMVKFSRGTLMAMVLFFSPIFYGTAWFIGTQVPQLQEYNEAKAYKGGVAHLLWPGKHYVDDPLEVARTCELDNECDSMEFEWNYPAAVEYLRFVGEIPQDSVPK